MLTSITNNLSLNIDLNHIVLRHQIYEYTQKHENSSKLTTTVRELIKFIVLINSKNNQKTFKRSITKSQSIEVTSYFEN